MAALVGEYERVLSKCARLQMLRLISCRCAEESLVVDTPCSEVRELVLEECSFMVIELRALPRLARLACRLTDTLKIVFGSLPSLTHNNLTFSIEDDTVLKAPHNDQFNQFVRISPTMASLVVRFTGLRRWIVPTPTPLVGLKRALVADLPSNWDISWPRCLLLSAPSLHVLHIHVPRSEDEAEYLEGKAFWKKSRTQLRHHDLKELVIIGFTQRHIWFLKYVVTACTSLQRVVLHKDGHVRYNGLWDWEIVGRPCPWSDD